MKSKLVTLAEFAALSGRSLNTLRRWANGYVRADGKRFEPLLEPVGWANRGRSRTYRLAALERLDRETQRGPGRRRAA